MEKVYIVTRGNYSDYRIMRVFRSRQAAKRFIKQAEDHDEFYRASDYRIEEWEIGTGKELPLFHVWIDANGDADGSYENESVEYCEIVQSAKTGNLFLNCVIAAENKEHAIKVANERRAMLIASGQWQPGVIAK